MGAGEHGGCQTLAMPDQTPQERDETTLYTGSLESLPIDLEEVATNGEEASCHVCGSPARVIVEMLDPTHAIGDAIFLCDDDFRLVSIGDQDSLCTRLATNYEESPADVQAMATLMTDGTGRAVQLPDISST